MILGQTESDPSARRIEFTLCDRPRVGMPFRCAAYARPGTPFPGGESAGWRHVLQLGCWCQGACGAGRRSAREGGRGARADPGR
jgi:hypothetical protein